MRGEFPVGGLRRSRELAEGAGDLAGLEIVPRGGVGLTFDHEGQAGGGGGAWVSMGCSVFSVQFSETDRENDLELCELWNSACFGNSVGLFSGICLP